MIPPDAIVLGPNHWCSPITDDLDELIGYVMYHTNRDEPSRVCQSPVYLDVAAAKNAGIPEQHRWQVIHLDPISLQPSIQCLRCGDQGWVQNAAWKPFRGAA